MFKQLKLIPLIKTPESGFKNTDKCLLLTTSCLITFRLFIKKYGKELQFPKGFNLLRSLINLFLIDEEDN